MQNALAAITIQVARPGVAQNCEDRFECVLESDLLPFFVGAAIVGDRNFVDAGAAACELQRDFRLDAESRAS